MSRRIDIELTSARPDGTWTWRAAGAREPKGVLDGGLLPDDSKVGAVLKADAEYEMDGITILSVGSNKTKAEKAGLLEMIATDKPFEAVTQQLAKRDRNDRGDRPRRDGDSRPRRDADSRPRRDGAGPGRDGERGARPGGADRPARDQPNRGERGPRNDRPRRPHFEAPPELPQRPKARRLKPGRAHRNAVLEQLPEAQRPVAERALQGGIPAVRQAVNEQNARLKAAGSEEIPAAGLLAMAEQLLPTLRVAEWLDRADAAMADLEELDLRDLRSVVAAADDPVVARDETARKLAATLKEALVTKQEKELALWFEDIEAALSVGRIVRALKLSSQPPKAGVRFPAELAAKLSEASSASLTADALPDRWVAVLEAAAFSPVRLQVQPAAAASQVNDELTATVKRLSALLPHIAALFGVAVAEKAQAPKPLRPARPGAPKKMIPKPPAPPAPSASAPVAEAPAAEAPVADTAEVVPAVEVVDVVESPVAEAPAAETAEVVPVVEVVESPVAEAPVADTAEVVPAVDVVESPAVDVVESPVAEAPAAE